MGGAHALGSHVGGGGRKTTRTRESQGGRGDNHTLHTALKKLLFNCVPQIFLSGYIDTPYVEMVIQSVNLKPWYFTNDSLGLPHAHSFSVCLSS